ncbi:MULTISPECIES: hypothetical protein [Clostridium]|uniref:hypothetical protein n=1 Tax=Clostridium TaxID=1485 RepID=UPI00115A7A9F|nr:MULTISPECIES: hypothetical protein [Clostridium]MDY4605398.1 hypothetical protein [Clostridium tertium]
MIKVNNIVKFKTNVNPIGDFGKVREIFEIKESSEKERIGELLYRIDPLENNTGFSYDDIERKDILEIYSKEENEENANE